MWKGRGGCAVSDGHGFASAGGGGTVGHCGAVAGGINGGRSGRNIGCEHQEAVDAKMPYGRNISSGRKAGAGDPHPMLDAATNNRPSGEKM